MERIPSSPPRIPALPEGTIRPLWSVMIPVYNCSRFIPDALGSVLSQDLGEDIMQIEVVDDSSTDADVETLVMTFGKGRVKYYRQPQNVGSLRNFETCINRANGHLVHLLHGDDRVKEGFYKKFTALFEEYPEAGAAFCRHSSINIDGIRIEDSKFENRKDGIIIDALFRLAEEQRIQYVSMVVKRVVYENLGSFYGVHFGEDWEMWVRIAKNYPIAYTHEIYAEYRKHTGSIARPKNETGQNAMDWASTISVIENYLPRHQRKIMKKARLRCASFCQDKSYVIRKNSGDSKKAFELMMLAFRISRFSMSIIMRFFKLEIKYLFKSKFKIMIGNPITEWT